MGFLVDGGDDSRIRIRINPRDPNFMVTHFEWGRRFKRSYDCEVSLVKLAHGEVLQ